ncbi:hypothetical protein VNI00_016982 [Paramarasmius palmivorus]|uniref:Uncharacterized protein n=1 Tax=Paramarasmius palmivorus TaxID=297713 RepID=A0AAW0BAD7_9AGAR
MSGLWIVILQAKMAALLSKELCPTNWLEFAEVTQEALGILMRISSLKWELDAAENASVDDAVDVLYNYLYLCFAPRSFTPKVVPNVVLEGADLPIQYLLSTEDTVNVIMQQGQGLAPTCELFSVAAHRMLQDPGFWDSTVEGFITLNLTIPHNNKHLLQAKVYGALTLVHVE